MSGFLSAGILGANAIPDSAVFDDWADNNLTNRDDFSTTFYAFNSLAGGTPDDRPEWSEQDADGGSINATNNNLVVDHTGQSGNAFIGTTETDMSHVSEGATFYVTTQLVTEGDELDRWNCNIITEDATVAFADNRIQFFIQGEDNLLELLVVEGGNENAIISDSVTISTGADFGILAERDGDGNWELWFDPDDPENPDSSESIGTATETFLPDASGNGGVSWNTPDDCEFQVDRMELF